MAKNIKGISTDAMLDERSFAKLFEDIAKKGKFGEPIKQIASGLASKEDANKMLFQNLLSLHDFQFTSYLRANKGLNFVNETEYKNQLTEESFNEYLEHEEAKKDIQYSLIDIFPEQVENTSNYKSFKRQIDKQGFLEIKTESGPVNIYTPELAFIFTSKELPVTEMFKSEKLTINGWNFVKTFAEAYKEGEDYFDKEFGVPPSTLYGPNAESYVKGIHENYFHIKHQDINDGWRWVKITYPLTLSHKDIRKYGYYSGIISKVDKLVKKHPILFKTYDKCDHESQETAETKNEFPEKEISRTKQTIQNELESIDKVKSWGYAFKSENDYLIFVSLLTDYFEYTPYNIPKKQIELKRDCKTRFAKALRPIHKELSNENKKLKNDTEFYKIIKILNHFKNLSDVEIYDAINR